MRLAHSEILPMASVAVARLGLVDVSGVHCCSGQFHDAILGTEGLAVTSRGYSLETGRLAYLVLVRMCAARTKPSPPLIRSSITASFQDDLGPSS